MKKFIQFTLVLFPLAFCVSIHAQSSDFTISMHVTHSETLFLTLGNFVQPFPSIEAVIDGHKVKMIAAKIQGWKGGWNAPTVFKCGDYKARIIKETNVDAAEYTREYELQIPGGGTLKFFVFGESE